MVRHESIPEMDLAEFAWAMEKHFDVLCESVAWEPHAVFTCSLLNPWLHDRLDHGESNYAVRFIGSRLGSSVSKCAAIQVLAHNRGTRLSPLSIKAVLAEFNVLEADFLQANGGGRG
jgi:hypothetical protein